MPRDLTLLDSITDVTASDAGTVAVSGSHGGVYPASVASAASLRAVIFNDAGIGLDRAGIGGVAALAGVGMAAAAVDCMSAQIGSARDLLDNGRISFANDVAVAMGITLGMSVRDAVQRLQTAPAPHATLPQNSETRQTRQLCPDGVLVHLLDSAAMVGPEHIGQIVVTGSHGGLIGGAPERALKARARIAVFNDAGGGPDNPGSSRLPALATQSVAAVTVSADSARIGDAASALDCGIISHANAPARALGARAGLSLLEWLSDQSGCLR